MGLPDNFSPAEHLQDVFLKSVNRQIREYFSDLGDESWQHDVSTPRGSLRVACTHQDSDNLGMTQLRLWLFYFVVGNAEKLQAPIYGLPITTFNESLVYLPQVVLYFREKASEATTHNRRPIEAQVGFRIIDSNFSKSEAHTLATKIKQLFGEPSRFYFKKGRTKFSYRDKAKGYEFIIAAFSEAEAKKVIEQVLDLQNHTPDWELLTDSESGRNWSATKYKNILGNTYKLAERRPIGTVYFTKAELKIHGLPHDIVLHDATGYNSGALLP